MISAKLRKVTDGRAYKAAISRFVQFLYHIIPPDILNLQQADKKERLLPDPPFDLFRKRHKK